MSVKLCSACLYIPLCIAMQYAVIDTSGWLVEAIIGKAALKFVSTILGVLCVMMTGTFLMLKSCAECSISPITVSFVNTCILTDTLQ